MTTLIELAQLCERAEGPSAELDRAIWAACVASVQHLAIVEAGRAAHGEGEAAFRTDRLMDGRRYTVSLDAALTLVPAPNDDGNYTWATGNCHEEEYDSWACVTEPPEGSRDFTAHGATPALALCAAALRARSKGEGV